MTQEKVFQLFEYKSFSQHDARVEINENGYLTLCMRGNEVVLQEHCGNLSYELFNWDTGIAIINGKKSYKMAIYSGERGQGRVEGTALNAQVTGGVFDDINRHRNGIAHPDNPRGLVPPHVQDLIDTLDAYGAVRVEGGVEKQFFWYSMAILVAVIALTLLLSALR